jgi:hypothetical protein
MKLLAAMIASLARCFTGSSAGDKRHAEIKLDAVRMSAWSPPRLINTRKTVFSAKCGNALASRHAIAASSRSPR